MGGCLKRIGCLVVLAMLAATAWLTRDLWLPWVRGTPSPSGTRAVAVAWEPLSADRAARARRALDRLGARTGPVFANLTGAEGASLVYQGLLRDLPRSADSAQAAVIGQRLYLRASVNVNESGARDALGPIGGLLGDRERVQFGGSFHVVRPGLAEFVVEEVTVRDVAVPAALIPRLLQRLERGTRPAGLAPTGLPLEIPRWIADVRVTEGKITVYKSVD